MKYILPLPFTAELNQGFSYSALKQVLYSGAKSISGLPRGCCFCLVSPDASIKDTRLTGASSVWELSAHQLINSANKAKLLGNTLALLPLPLSPTMARRTKWGDPPRGLQDLRLEFMLLYFPAVKDTLTCIAIISLLHPSAGRNAFAESKVQPVFTTD